MSLSRKLFAIAVVLMLLLGAGLMSYKIFLPEISTPTVEPPQQFAGERALRDVTAQVALGPRTPGSQAHADFINWAQKEFEASGWTTEEQQVKVMEHDGTNIIARRAADSGKPVIIVGAHYDSRFVADNDPDPTKRNEPVIGANDGASGVAVLLELARVLPKDMNVDVWLVLFDIEDQGNLKGWDWSLGAQGFEDQLEVTPQAAVIVDMIGDADLTIYKENNSTDSLVEEIWAKASELGYPQFIAQNKHSITDDHIPFLRAGIPAVDIIDIEYPYWHTTQDTTDKVSAESLTAVGDTVLAWLKSK